MKISILSLVLVIAVAIFSFFQFERYQNLENATKSYLEALNNTISNTVNPQIQSLQQDVRKLANQEAQLVKQHPTAITLLTEVEYLTNMAEVNLETSGDIDTVIHLLKIAEAKLQDNNDVKISTIRQTLIEDRTALQAIKQANTTEIWQQITQMMNDVPNLSLLGVREETNRSSHEKISVPITAKADENLDWKQALAKSWQEIKGLIIIRHHTKAIEPILSETDTQLVKQNLFLLLEQLRLSVLQKNQTLYKNLINETKHWLETYFAATDPKVIAMQHTLTDLEQITLKPVLPNLQRSLMQLQSLRN